MKSYMRDCLKVVVGAVAERGALPEVIEKDFADRGGFIGDIFIFDLHPIARLKHSYALTFM